MAKSILHEAKKQPEKLSGCQQLSGVHLQSAPLDDDCRHCSLAPVYPCLHDSADRWPGSGGLQAHQLRLEQQGFLQLHQALAKWCSRLDDLWRRHSGGATHVMSSVVLAVQGSAELEIAMGRIHMHPSCNSRTMTT